MRRLTVWGAWLTLVALGLAALTACGGDDDGGGDDGGATQPAATATSDSTDSGDAGADSGSTDAGSGGSDFGTGTAMVTIGDQQYEFDLTSGFTVCRDVFDAIQVSGSSADDSDVDIHMWIPPTNWDTYDDERYDPPSIRVTDDTNNHDWVANPNTTYNVEEGKSQVDSYDKDGLTASGSATFFDGYALLRGEDAQPVQGSFEVGCNE